MQLRHLLFVTASALASSSIALACSYSALIWTPGNTADPLYRFVRDGKAGYIDSTGQVVIPPTFEDRHENLLDEFHDGRLAVNLGTEGFVDTRGRKVIDTTFYLAYAFSEGLAVVQLRQGGPQGYIDTSGRMVIPPQFAESQSFSQGVASVLVKERAGYIDRRGNFLIKPQFFRARSFSEDRAWVVAEGPCHWFKEEPVPFVFGLPDTPQRTEMVLLGPPCMDPYLPASFSPLSIDGDPLKSLIPCKYALIDRTGAVISKNRFDDVGEFSEGLAPVKVGTRWGYVDRSGAIVIEPRFEYAYPFSDARAMVVVNKLNGYIDRTGNFAIQPQFNFAENFSDGLAVVSQGSGPFWYIDRDGRPALNAQFDLAGSFMKGIAHVKLLPTQGRNLGRFAYIDRSGNPIFTYER